MNAEVKQIVRNISTDAFWDAALSPESERAARLELVSEDDEITDVNVRCDDVKVYQYALERERARHEQTRLDCDAESARAEQHADNARRLRVEVRELTEECRDLETSRNVVLVLAFIGMALSAVLGAMIL